MRKQKVVYWTTLLVTFLIGLSLFGTRLRFISSIPQYYKVAATLPDEIKAAKQEGLPMAAADLDRPISVPDDQNAALLYAQFPKINISEQEDAARSAVLKGKATDADRQTTQRMLEKAAPQLHLAEQAALLPECDFHRNWKLGPNLLLPEYAPAREMARLLGVKAVMQSDAGHPEEALHTIWVGARMAQHIGRDPIFIAMLVRIAIEAIMNQAFQYVLKHNADRPDILRQASQTEQAFGEMPDIGYSLRGEVVMCRIMADMVRSSEAQSHLNKVVIPVTGTPRTVAADAYEAHSLSYWRRVFAAVNSKRGDPMEIYHALKAVCDAEEAMESDKDGKPKPTYELSGMLCPFFATGAEKIASNEAERRLRRTFLALLAYRQREGHFPAALSQLTPRAPDDPFLPQPLRYHKTDQGFLLYSVGSNLKDDGGIGISPKQGAPRPDIVVSFP